MKKTYLMLISTFCFGMIVLTLGTGTANAQPPFPVPPTGGLPACEADLTQAQGDLDTCHTDLAACEATPCQVFPGDGYPNPDDYDVSGHGPALSYMDNGDGTFTDDNTGLMWEKKDTSGGIHDKGNTYTWSSLGTAADGTLFNGTSTIGTDFLYTLNNTCAGDETMSCTNDTDCTGIGNETCGFAGYRDWRIPNVKELQSIVDYSTSNPAFSAFGAAASDYYWSATTDANRIGSAWDVGFGGGNVFFINKKSFSYFARAVRP